MPQGALLVVTMTHNNGVQPTACAVGIQVKGHGGLAHAAADAGRWADEKDGEGKGLTWEVS